MAKLVFRTEQQKKDEKGGQYIRMSPELTVAFKSLMRDLGFDPENPRADKAVKQVGEMVAGFGIDLARACMATSTETLVEYTEKVKAEATEAATVKTKK